jgi:hypothetical protein
VFLLRDIRLEDFVVFCGNLFVSLAALRKAIKLSFQKLPCSSACLRYEYVEGCTQVRDPRFDHPLQCGVPFKFILGPLAGFRLTGVRNENFNFLVVTRWIYA